MVKKASTLVNFVMLGGMLLFSSIIFLNLNRITLWQASQTESDLGMAVLQRISDTISFAESYPNDLNASMEIPTIEEYTLTISRGSLNIFFPASSLNLTKRVSSYSIFLLPSMVSNSRVLYLYKQGSWVMIASSMKCDIADQVCDPGCAFYNACDPACNQDVANGACLPACVDRNGDGIITREDTDRRCDPDCYSNTPIGIYDYDCLASNDNICDPDTHNLRDGYCDKDCSNENGICDPDCSVDPDCRYQVIP